jgi:hypothetical protein
MREDDYPHPVSEPAAAGLPDYADDDSTAYDDVRSGREADGRDPAALPVTRDDGPVALDDFGTTAEEQRRGESLEGRLAREEPDIRPEDVEPDLASLDEEPVESHRDSPVSTFERLGPDPVTGGQVGRLVAPDEGSGIDTEADEIALDVGAAGGGAGPEELAIHEVSEDYLDDEPEPAGDADLTAEDDR